MYEFGKLNRTITSTGTRLISWTEPGTNPARRGAKIRSSTYTIGLISWAASEGSTLSWLWFELVLETGAGLGCR